MTTELDLIVINDFMRDAATRAVADAIRVQTGQLALTPSVHGSLAPIHAFALDHQERVLHATVRPVAGEPLYERPSWLMRHWPEVVGGLVIAAAVGIGAWLLILAIAAAFAALTALVPLLAIGALVLIVIALCSRGGKDGRSFSGTFEGRMH